MDPSSFLHDKQQRDVRNSRIKLILMLVVLVALVSVMAQLGQRAFRGKHSASEPFEPGEAVVGGKPPGPPPRGEGVELEAGAPGKTPNALNVSPDEVEKKFPFITDPKSLELIRDQDTEIEPAPFFYTLYRASRETDAKLEGDAAEMPDWKTLWEQPASLRGKAVRVTGRIIQIWRQPIGANPMGLDEVWAYRLRAHDAPIKSKGHLYDVYSIQKLKGALRHDHVTAFGLFLKAQVSEPERIDDPEFHVAVFIARRFEPLTYLDDPKIPEPIVQGNRPEARAFYWLLARARAVPFKKLEAAAAANEKLAYLDYVNDPERHVAKPVAIMGELRRLIRIELPENLLGLPDIYYGQIVDRDRRMNTFYCLSVPEGIHLKDPVFVYGYYLKKWTYISGGGEEVTSPVFVAKQMQIVDIEGSQDHTLEIVLLAVILLTGIALGVVTRADRRRDRAANEARRQRQLSRIPDDLNEVARQRAADARDTRTHKPPKKGE